jgi:hypothetical protein
MRFPIDECLHQSLVELAQGAGFEATHVNHLDLNGKPDWALAERITKRRIHVCDQQSNGLHPAFGKMELHPGLIVLVPNVVPALQRALFQAALQYSAQKDLINTVVEVTLDGKAVRCVEYELPTE